MNALIREYSEKKELIQGRLMDFRSLNEGEWFDEMLFCLLTPQSNAKKCWEAVIELKNKGVNRLSEKEVARILKTKTRFHNNKAKYVKLAVLQWGDVKKKLDGVDNDVVDVRNWIAESVCGMGYKEAGHFLRNIGKSDNKIAILDRHILRNLKELGVIKSEELKGKDSYFEVERKFAEFAFKVGIPIDELDLLFWSRENGEVFK
jgi:N-glycosylase/DNA lyase